MIKNIIKFIISMLWINIVFSLLLIYDKNIVQDFIDEIFEDDELYQIEQENIIT